MSVVCPVPRGTAQASKDAKRIETLDTAFQRMQHSNDALKNKIVVRLERIGEEKLLVHSFRTWKDMKTTLAHRTKLLRMCISKMRQVNLLMAVHTWKHTAQFLTNGGCAVKRMLRRVHTKRLLAVRATGLRCWPYQPIRACRWSAVLAIVANQSVPLTDLLHWP